MTTPDATHMTSLDRVSLKKMSFYAFHGTSLEEQKTGRRYEVDCDCWLDIRSAADSDAINRTMDYSVIYERTAQIMSASSVTLLETLAEKIASDMLESPRVKMVTVTVRKLNPPINGLVDAAEVEITRQR